MSHTIATTARYSASIDMWTLDRGIENSCIHATKFCREHCYNNKFYTQHPTSTRGKDIKNDIAWNSIAPQHISDFRARMKRARTKRYGRVRLMSRGEAFRDYTDILRVSMLANGLHDCLVWIPTRAWHNPSLWAQVQILASKHSNLRVLASIDPSDAPNDVLALESRGYSTMYFGDDSALITQSGGKRFRCPKTWAHIEGACQVCKRGCFNGNNPVHIHLKEH